MWSKKITATPLLNSHPHQPKNYIPINYKFGNIKQIFMLLVFGPPRYYYHNRIFIISIIQGQRFQCILFCPLYSRPNPAKIYSIETRHFIAIWELHFLFFLFFIYVFFGKQCKLSNCTNKEKIHTCYLHHHSFIYCVNTLFPFSHHIFYLNDWTKESIHHNTADPPH